MSTPRHPQFHGFTIIEVMIVLAIAALIMMVVFLAVPALRRAERNHMRKEAVDYIVGELDEYYSLYRRYPLSGTRRGQDERTAFVNQLTSGGITTGFDIRYTDNDGSHEYPFSGSGAPRNPQDALDEVSIEPAHRCNRTGRPGQTDYPLESSHLGDSNYRVYAVWTLLEGNNSVYCVSNEH